MDLRRRRRWWPVVGVLAGLLLVRMAVSRTIQALDAAPGQAADVLRSVDTTTPAVALTFDVEWGEKQPQAVLDVLAQTRTPATFFVSGPWALGHPDVVRAMLAQGDEVESLGYRYIPLARYPDTVVREELTRANEAIASVTGHPPAYLRPPAGDVNAAVTSIAAADGLRVVLWSLESFDELQPGVDAIVARVTRRARAGAIIHLHADDNATETAAALPAIISGLRARGLRCVTLARLVALARQANPAAG